MKKRIAVNMVVQVLNGKYKGRLGMVREASQGQYTVEMPDGELRYLGINDIVHHSEAEEN